MLTKEYAALSREYKDHFGREEEFTELKKLFAAKEIAPEVADASIETYLQLLPFAFYAAKKENLADPLNAARDNAAKLAVTFETYGQAIDYLSRFEQQMRAEDGELYTSHLVHEACLFNLPESKGWTPKLWQTVIKQNPPSHPNNLILRLLPMAGKIEQYVVQNRIQIEQSEKQRITDELKEIYSKNFAQDYEIKRKEISNKIEYVSARLKAQHKNLQKRKDTLFENHLRQDLGIDANPTPDNNRKLRERKKNLTSNDMQKRTEIEKEIDEAATIEIEKDYAKQKSEFEGVTKEEYVQTKLATARKEIEKSVVTKLAAELLSDKSKISIPTIEKYAREAGHYSRANENRLASQIFFSEFMPEKVFDAYLDLKPQDDSQQIPDLKIDGAEISEKYKDYYLMKLSPNDPRAAVLGEFTGCCQSLGKEGQDCVIHGITDPRGGFYVLCKKEGKPNTPDSIVAQCWAWRNRESQLVFDSVESQIDFRKNNKNMIVDFYTSSAHRLVIQHNVPTVLIGRGGNTPKSLGIFVPFRMAVHHDYLGYSDSKDQRIICDQTMPLFYLYKSAQSGMDELLKDKNFLPSINRQSLLNLCDYVVQNGREDLIEKVMLFAKAGNVDEAILMDRIKFIQNWLNFIDGNNNLDNETLIQFLDKDPGMINIPNKHNMTALGIAISKGDGNAMTLLLERGAKLDHITEHEKTALEHACEKNQKDLIKLLVERYQLDLNCKNSKGQSLLHVASAESAPDSIRYLLEQGLDLNHVDPNGNRPIDYLLDGYRPDWEAVRMMLPKTNQVTARFAGFLLKEIFEDKKTEFLYLLLDRCPDLFIKVKNIDPTIQLLISKRNWNAIKDLISAGLDPKFNDKGGYTLLHSAIDNKQIEMVDWLCANGADINFPGSCNPPLIHATFEDNWNIVDLLIDRGAVLDVKGNGGKTILELAAKKNQWTTVTKLIVKDVDLSPLKDLELPEDIKRLIEGRKASRTEFFQSEARVGDFGEDDQKIVPKPPGM